MPSEDIDGESPPKANITKRLQETKLKDSRACDSCYHVKEKCVWLEGQLDCHRCHRLKKTCTTDRPIRLGGRPRKKDRTASLPANTVCKRNVVNRNRQDEKTATDLLVGSLSPFGIREKGLTSLEVNMLHAFLEPSNFGMLMVIPRVGKEMHQQAVYSLLHRYDDLHDGYFSMYGTFAAEVGLEIAGLNLESNITRATKALRKFSAIPCSTDNVDFVSWLFLGVSVMINGHFLIGNNPPSVRKHVLAHMAQLERLGHGHYASHPVMMCIIAFDIFDCLLHGDAPMVDMPEAQQCEEVMGSETFIGACHQLFRLMYQLCHLRLALDDATMLGDIYEFEIVNAQLDSLDEAVRTWQPQISAEQLSSKVAVRLLLEARTNKTMISLFIHRLRHPFGTEDSAAKTMAASIMSDLELSLSTTGISSTWLTLPFILSSIESTSPSERAFSLANVSKHVNGLSFKTGLMTKRFLTALWEVRDFNGFGFKWMDMMERLPPLPFNYVSSENACAGKNRGGEENGWVGMRDEMVKGGEILGALQGGESVGI